jgi:hypothetical protein
MLTMRRGDAAGLKLTNNQPEWTQADEQSAGEAAGLKLTNKTWDVEDSEKEL